MCVHVCWVASVLSYSAVLWTTACQAPLSWDSPGKNAAVGRYAILQGVFWTQGSNTCLLRILHCRQILYHWATGEVPFMVQITYKIFPWLSLLYLQYFSLFPCFPLPTIIWNIIWFLRRQTWDKVLTYTHICWILFHVSQWDSFWTFHT